MPQMKLTSCEYASLRKVEVEGADAADDVDFLGISHQSPELPRKQGDYYIRNTIRVACWQPDNQRPRATKENGKNGGGTVHDGVSVEAMNLGDERGLGDVLREVAVDEQMPTSADALRFVFTDVCESFRLPTMVTASLGTYE
ncbi:unnamed protein product [Miscanthus lutarioriparius]|uniref:Uncharacterized protein n=1 Tax=Miscanthus lutarioriparius TaxID=422564 RepID=A0A811QZL8_9POAL|nr:unnamed protein product [Miscanthus lutarioriparius]